MRIIERPYAEIDWETAESGTLSILQRIEVAGRTAHKSEDKIEPGSEVSFADMIMAKGHYSVLEHVSVSARVICDRGLSHEIVRHRLAAYTQESTRFCNYSKDKFGTEITVVLPSFLWEDPDELSWRVWHELQLASERTYFELLDMGVKPQFARSVLTNALKTEIVMTLNLRAWRHFFFMRTSKAAHPDMQYLAGMMLDEFRDHIPILFDEVNEK